MAERLEPLELLDRHVTAFNLGVEVGDWDPLVDGFTPDGELVFVGVEVGPFSGRPAIVQAYRESPPDDEIRVVERSIVGGDVVAAYVWSRGEGKTAGLLVITPKGDKIRRLVVTFAPH